MCNGESTRLSQGGTIAILRPLPTAHAQQRELSLRFAHDAAVGTTRAHLDGFLGAHAGDSHVIIHRDGDLTTGRMTDASVLHSIRVPSSNTSGGEAGSGLSFALSRQLDLGVGGDGVIGRRVSFVKDRVVLGHGIIGWN